jgi:tungsten cofactor oxidoreducase radical SAM maturase
VNDAIRYHQINTGSEVILLPLVPDIRKIYIEATAECNFSCVTCIRHSWCDEMGQMSPAVFERIVASFAALPDLRTIHFGGFGEPLTHPEMIRMISRCTSMGLAVEMITNGSLLNETTALALIDAGLDYLFVSLDGSDSASYENIRPGADYEEVVGNIKQLQRLKKERQKVLPRIGIEFVATKANFTRLPFMRKVVDELNADRFVVTNMLPYHESMKDEILYDKGADMLDFGLESQLLSVKTAPKMKLETQRSCRFVESKAMAITWQGNVSPCYALMHNYDCYILGRKKTMQAYHVGNVMRQSLADIWIEPEYATFRWISRNAHYPSCTDCRQADGCNLAQTNESDCWGNKPSCGDCLWARDLIVCP